MNHTEKKHRIQSIVLKVFREIYETEQADEEILSTEPNAFDISPEPFYEELIIKFNLSLDYDEEPYFGGLGGKVSDTISFIGNNCKDFDELEQNENDDKELAVFFDNYDSNFKTLSKQNVEMYFNMLSMMIGRISANKVRRRFKLALEEDNWDSIMKVLKTTENKKDMFSLESLKEMASYL